MKPITATAFMTLVDEGTVGLDDPVHRYIPSFKDLRVFCPRSNPLACEGQNWKFRVFVDCGALEFGTHRFDQFNLRMSRLCRVLGGRLLATSVAEGRNVCVCGGARTSRAFWASEFRDSFKKLFHT